MKPKFRAWLKEEYRMTDVREITFFNDEIQMISDVEGFYAYDEFELMQSTGLKDIEVVGNIYENQELLGGE